MTSTPIRANPVLDQSQSPPRYPGSTQRLAFLLFVKVSAKGTVMAKPPSPRTKAVARKAWDSGTRKAWDSRTRKAWDPRARKAARSHAWTGAWRESAVDSVYGQRVGCHIDGRGGD
jgi:hypothetical protein